MAEAINQMLKMGFRAEQQVLAKHGLNYVIEKYLPQKLKKTDSFLPKALIYPRCGKEIIFVC